MSKIIVHIDDDQDIRHAVRLVLSREGYTIHSFETVKEFMAAMNTLSPDLVLLDVMVEEDDAGLQAYDQLRTRYPQLPIILMTSLGEMVLPHFAHSPELVWVLEKPVTPEKLISTVKARML
jgi:DNA-binding NtrC family response regulator